MARKELLLGCGSRRTKMLFQLEHKEFENVVTLDVNLDHDPDVVWDINKRPLPFDDNEFDEIHAYEVLEHIGRQGDYAAFFDEFSDYWRIMKPGGFLFGTSPNYDCPWAWGDPGHTRIISPGLWVFLHQPSYAQVGKTAMADYRFCYKADFDLVLSNTIKSSDGISNSYQYTLRAVKPSRITQ